eukprot:6469911-Amphidinium_carterae.1
MHTTRAIAVAILAQAVASATAAERLRNSLGARGSRRLTNLEFIEAYRPTATTGRDTSDKWSGPWSSKQSENLRNPHDGPI